MAKETVTANPSTRGTDLGQRIRSLVARRPDQAAVIALMSVHIAIVWLLPILPCQDLPQHLTYATILRDYDRPDLPFKEYYELPQQFQPYFGAHYVLALLGGAMPITDAVRLLLSGYAVAMFFAFRALVRAIHRPKPDEPMWSMALGSLLVWSPVACLGVLEFTLGMPLILASVALLLDCPEHGAKRSHRWLVASGAALVFVHPVAAGCVVLFAVVHAAMNPSRGRGASALAVFMGSVFAFAFWAFVGQTGVGSHASIDWTNEMRKASGLEFISEGLQLRWYDPTINLGYVLWTVFGPFRLPVVAGLAVLFGAAAWVVAKARPLGSRDESSSPIRIPLRSIGAFAVVSWLAPWGLYVPTEITFLNLRLMAIAFALTLACVPPAWFSAERARRALVAACAFGAVHFGARAAGFWYEARPALSLLREAKPLGPMLSLDYHFTSEQFGQLFRVTHFLPMYYTVTEGGINAQFWARYTEHLPVGYRNGKQFRAPPDWQPQQFKAEHVAEFTYVLVQSAAENDAADNREASRSAAQALETVANRIRCEGLWCLYRVRR